MVVQNLKQLKQNKQNKQNLKLLNTSFNFTQIQKQSLWNYDRAVE